MRSRIEPMKKIARTQRTHRELLLKVIMRRSYGFRAFRILELALYYSLGKLPQPTLSHEFF